MRTAGAGTGTGRMLDWAQQQRANSNPNSLANPPRDPQLFRDSTPLLGIGPWGEQRASLGFLHPDQGSCASAGHTKRTLLVSYSHTVWIHQTVQDLRPTILHHAAQCAEPLCS